MTLFIIVGENNETYGIFRNRIKAEKEIKAIYEKGYFGTLEIREDNLKD